MIYEPLRIFDERGGVSFAPDRARTLLDMCRNKSVLHVGCTDAPLTTVRLTEGTLLHASLSNVSARAVGIDICTEGLRLLREAGFTNVLQIDAERMGLEDFGERFDVVLAGDVMEHMNNPGLFVESAKKVMLPDGVLIVGVPSALTLNNLKSWFLRREDVHTDHCFYFSPKTLSRLCSRYGLLPTQLAFTVQPLTSGESGLFGWARERILKCFKSMSPSFIMSFRHREVVNQSKYFLWR